MAPPRTLLLCLVLLACSPRADAPARTDSPPAPSAPAPTGPAPSAPAPRTPVPSAPHAEPGVSPRSGNGGADGGSCAAGQQRCCDGQCDTPEACAVLVCDPAPAPPVEVR